MPMIGNVLILLLSLLIYSCYGLWPLTGLLAAVLVSWLTALATPRHKWVMWLSVAANALLLTLLKLEPVTGLGLLAPMGISYFALRLISYNVDVGCGKLSPEKNIFRFALDITYLPTLFLGPIDPYDPARFASRKITAEGIWDGLARLLWGGFKKLVVAARVGVVIGAISGDTQGYRGIFALAAMLLYSVQLYADFSGGIDMVLGLSRMLGLRWSENFDAPYLAQSFREFWRCWHISLGAWLRAYVYIPLGGNRKGKIRKVVNTLTTFLVSGLWHGVHYLVWGVLNGIFVSMGECLKTRWKLLNRALVFLGVSLLWSFFVWPDTLTALEMLASVVTDFEPAAFAAGIGGLGLTLGDWIVLALAVPAMWTADVYRKTLRSWYSARCPEVKTALLCATGILVLVFGMYGIGFNAQAFIYSSF